MVEKSEKSMMDDNENYLELSKMNFSPFTTSFANVNVNQFAKFTQNLATPSQVLSLVSGSDGNVQFLQTQPQMTSPATTMNPTQTYITLPITIPPSKPGDATQTFQIQVLNPNPVQHQAPKFQMGQMQIPIHGLQQHGTTVLTVAYSPQDGEILPNQMPDGGPVTVLAAIQPQDLQLLAQQNGLAQAHHLHAAHHASDSDDNHEKEKRINIKQEPPFWAQNPVTISAPNLTTDLSEYFHARNMNLQPYLKFNTDGLNIKKEMYSDALAQLQLSDNNNIISINNNYNADNSNTSLSAGGDTTHDQSTEMESSQMTENGEEGDEKIEVDSNGKLKKKRKIKKKPPKPKRPKPGQVHIATALDGTILFCCPQCQMAYPEKESLESHLAVHKIERRYICDICGAGLKRKEHLERHKLGHNPERPYVCHVCLKGFKRKEHLNLHAVIHSGLKTEICSECGKGFYRKDHLRKHIKSHSTKRLKEEASTSNHQESSNNEVFIKRERLSPGCSPHSIPKTNEDVPRTLSLQQFNLPQEVTIHVTSNNTTIPVQIQHPQLMTRTAPDGTSETVVVKMPTNS